MQERRTIAAPDPAQYHLAELKIAQDASSPGHLLPPIPDGCRSILDIGCGAGQTLIASSLADDVLACGIDPDQAALALGRTLTTRIYFTAATGEALPYPAEVFDMVYSRVALPYTNIPVALAEIARVLRPGGTVWLSLHPARFALRAMGRALRARSLRGTIFPVYVVLNGLMLHLLGRQMYWPLGRRRFESVQTSGGIARALRRAGFTEVRVSRQRFFVVTARLP
jgi:ubiquinone/menaquinone biosynthesis C-methylase UbiE